MKTAGACYIRTTQETHNNTTKNTKTIISTSAYYSHLVEYCNARAKHEGAGGGSNPGLDENGA